MDKLNIYDKSSQGGIFLSPDDQLRISVISLVPNIPIFVRGTALDITGRIVQFEQLYNLANIQNPQTFQLNLGYTMLLSVVISCETVQVWDGQVYVNCVLSRPFSHGVWSYRSCLCVGYISKFSCIGWNGSTIEGVPGDHTVPFSFNPTNPAAGALLSTVIAFYSFNEIQSVRFQLTTDANVANRRAFFRTEDLVPNIQDFYCGVDQTASATRYYVFYPGAPFSGAFINNFLYAPIPPLYICNEQAITIGCTNIQVGDQIQNVSILCRTKCTPQ